VGRDLDCSRYVTALDDCPWGYPNGIGGLFFESALLVTNAPYRRFWPADCFKSVSVQIIQSEFSGFDGAISAFFSPGSRVPRVRLCMHWV